MAERDFQYQSLLHVNNNNNSSSNDAGECSFDEMAVFNSMFSSVSLLSLLTSAPPLPIPPEPLLPTLPPLFATDFASPNLPPPPPPPPPSFGFLSDANIPPSTLNFLLLPKTEPLSFGDMTTDETKSLPFPTPPPPPPFNFMFTGTDSSTAAPTEPLLFLHLPELLSLDYFSSTTAAAEDYSASSSSSITPLRKRARANPASQQPPQPPMVPRGSALARQRRQKLSDKTRCLQKLLPWDKKMDTATMLEEAYKYVKFLQAQLAALRSMPAVVSSSSSSTAGGGCFGGLGRLNRNQLLQVLVNSPVAQTTLSSRGCCVFSVEQLGLLDRLADMSRSSASAATARNISYLPPNRF
ncbi:hypothetical protein TIFTF001_027158 [Ficus carica]|uniref:BHLH domain-containing protein n=1 Tax=Ficus carica TaxID=3494 RepID=A0AA88DML1_FICCA|nr:hypothetical protein TIFTF001_027158 [Ficus carica]